MGGSGAPAVTAAAAGLGELYRKVAHTHHYGTNDAVVSFLESYYMAMETAVIVVGPIAAIMVWRYKMFGKFPGCFFKWLLYLDILGALFAGPLRWADGPVRPIMGAPTTEYGCYMVAMGDTFFHVATLVINTFVVGCIFYMIYFQNAKFSQSNRNWIVSLVGILGVAFVFALTALSGPVSSWIGWCTMDSVGVVLKLLIMCLFLSLQITLIIPTVLVITSASAKSKSATSTVMFLSFIGIIVCQMIGVVPMIVMEYMSYARISIPVIMKDTVLIGVASARIINTCLVIYKVLVKAFPKLVGNSGSRKSTRRFTRTGTATKSQNSRSDSGSSRSSRTGFSTAGEAGVKGEEPSLRLPGDRDYYAFIAAENAAATAAANQGTDREKSDKKKKKAMDEDQGLCSKLPIKYLLLAVISIPVILQGSAIVFVLDKQTQKKSAATVDEMNIGLATRIAHLLEESEKERGDTGVFVGSGGTLFKYELEKQRKMTDKAVAELQYFLDKEYNVGKVMTNQEFASGLGQMYLLPVHRHHVDIMDYTEDDSIYFFTELNTKFLHVLASVCEYMAEGTVDPFVYSTLAFITAEESVSHERGLGAGAFSHGVFKQSSLYKFIEDMTGQSSSSEIFQAYGTKDALKHYKKIQHGELHDMIERMKTVAIRNIPEELAMTNPLYWFEQLTTYIDTLWEIEESEAKLMEQKADEELTHDVAVIVDILLITTGSLILCGLTGLIVSQAIVGLRKTNRAANKHKENKKCAWFDHEVHLGFHSLWCIVVLFSVMVVMVNDESQHLRASSMMTNNCDLRHYLMEVFFRLQLERDSSALYVGSAGKLFVKEFGETFQETDHAIEEFQKYMESGDYMLQYILDAEPFNQMMVQLGDDLHKTRHELWHLKVDEAEGLEHYTELIRNIKKVIGYFTTHKDVRFAHLDNNRMFSFLTLLQAQEKLGVEVAHGALAANHNGFADNEHWTEFVKLVKERDTYLEYFRQFATPNIRAIMDSAKSTKYAKNVLRWENLMIANDWESEEIHPDWWFGNMTQKIHDFAVGEEAVLHDVFEHLEEVIHLASLEQVLFSTLMALSVISGVVVFMRIDGMLKEAKKLKLVAATPSMNSKVKAELEEYAYDKCVKCKTGLYCPRCHDKEFEMFQEMATITTKRSAVEDKIAEQRTRLAEARKVEVEEQNRKKEAARKKAAEEREALLAAQKAGADI